MKNMMRKIGKRIYHKYDEITSKYLVSYRRRKLNNTDFSIICNNCWAGYVYRRYGLPYNTPTIGLYFYAQDFIKLCYKPEYYFGLQLEFINASDSKWFEELKRKGQTDVPIGKLDDIEVIFLHYKTQEEAREKWERRVSRVNYNNIILKFSKMNMCSKKEIEEFERIECSKKICFVPPSFDYEFESKIVLRSESGSDIKDDTSEYSRYINLNKLINSKYVNGKKMR